MATIGLSKVFILDKYFTELQKFWETERKVQGKQTETRRGAPPNGSLRALKPKNVPINGKSVGGENMRGGDGHGLISFDEFNSNHIPAGRGIIFTTKPQREPVPR